MSEIDIPDLVRPGWIELFGVGPGIEIIKWSEEEVGFRHICTRPRDGLTVRVAPLLQLGKDVMGHQIISWDPFTVTPSLLCYDCGLHGHVTNGAWRSV